jgi:hypothetical protein
MGKTEKLNILFGKSKGKISMGKPRCRREDNVQIDPTETDCKNYI